MKKLLALSLLLTTMAFGGESKITNKCLNDDITAMATFEVFGLVSTKEREKTNLNVLSALRVSHVLLEHESELSDGDKKAFKERLKKNLDALENTPFMSKPEK